MSIDHTTRGLAAVVAGRAPGSELAALLDGVDPGELTGEDLAAYVRARFALHHRAEAALLAGMRELGCTQDGRSERVAHTDEFSGDEIAALLGHSRTMSARRLDLADDLFGRLPLLGAALWQGWLDEPKVRAVAESLTDVGDDHAKYAVAVVLPEAVELPIMALRHRVEEIVLDLDPDWAERRRRRAESRGRVMLSSNPSGTATLVFADAPAEEGIDSQARIDALAAAVRQLGVRTPIGPLRLRIGMRLLNGSTAGMNDRDIVLLLAAEYHATDPDGTGPSDAGPSDAGPDDVGPDDSGPDDSGPDDSGPDDSGPGDSGPDDDGPDDGGCSDGEPDDRGPDVSDRDGSSSPVPARRGSGEQGAFELPGLSDHRDDDEVAGAVSAFEEPDERRAGRLRRGTVEVGPVKLSV